MDADEGTSRATLEHWFDAGVGDGADYMIIVTDTFSYEDFPVYVRGNKDLASKRAHELEHAPLSKVMEVYDLRGDKAAQISLERSWAVPRPEPGPSTRRAEAALELLARYKGFVS